MLLRDTDQKARHIARIRQFSFTSGPVDSVTRVVADSVTSQRGHLVLAPVSEAADVAVCARIAAVLLGTYFADSADFVNKGQRLPIQRAVEKFAFGFFVSLSRTASPLNSQVCFLYFALSPLLLRVALNYFRYAVSPSCTSGSLGNSTWPF